MPKIKINTLNVKDFSKVVHEKVLNNYDSMNVIIEGKLTPTQQRTVNKVLYKMYKSAISLTVNGHPYNFLQYPTVDFKELLIESNSIYYSDGEPDKNKIAKAIKRVSHDLYVGNELTDIKTYTLDRYNNKVLLKDKSYNKNLFYEEETISTHYYKSALIIKIANESDYNKIYLMLSEIDGPQFILDGHLIYKNEERINPKLHAYKQIKREKQSLIEIDETFKYKSLYQFFGIEYEIYKNSIQFKDVIESAKQIHPDFMGNQDLSTVSLETVRTFLQKYKLNNYVRFIDIILTFRDEIEKIGFSELIKRRDTDDR